MKKSKGISSSETGNNIYETVNPTLKSLQRSLVPCSLEISKIVKHPDGRTVKIIKGDYLVDGRVSNFWKWREVLSDGELSDKIEQGYGW